ncbi:hypothetical protein [Pannonibacter sp.]|uniref:hypothetical protein n=1 Tax=Pannonibacter sp. TaxID=1906786 RepID=UPI003F711890
MVPRDRDAAPPPQSASAFWFLLLLGPPIAGVLVLWLLGANPLNLAVVAAALLPSYGLGLAPALLAGLVDRWCAGRGLGLTIRLAAVLLAAAAAAMGLVIPLFSQGLVQGWYPLLVGPVAAAATLLVMLLHAASRAFPR